MRPLTIVALPLMLGCSSADSESANGSPPIAVKQSTVELRILVLDFGGERAITGSFREGYKPRVSCERSAVAGCTINVCTDTGVETAGTPVDPGKITVSSPTYGNDVEVPVTNGSPKLLDSTPFPDAAEALRFVGAGSAKVAAFDLTVKMPTRPKLESIGSCPATSPVCESARDGITLSWTGGAGGWVRVELVPASAGTQTSLTCFFNGDSGKGRIPAQALAKLDEWDSNYGLRFVGGAGPVESQGGAGLPVAIDVERWATTPALKLK
jgi:hypothetical protein